MALATTTDVETRLGRALTSAEEAMAQDAIDDVSGMILEIAGTAEPSPVPSYYKALTVQKVINVGTNPNGAASESENIGSYSYSRTYQRSNDDGLFLTEREERMVRRIANNAVSGSSYPRALPHETLVSEPD